MTNKNDHFATRTTNSRAARENNFTSKQIPALRVKIISRANKFPRCAGEYQRAQQLSRGAREIVQTKAFFHASRVKIVVVSSQLIKFLDGTTNERKQSAVCHSCSFLASSLPHSIPTLSYTLSFALSLFLTLNFLHLSEKKNKVGFQLR